MERLEENYQDRDMIRCDDGNKVYLIPRRTFARMVLEVNVPGNKFVRYKTGADQLEWQVCFHIMRCRWMET